jgi:signal transduction histidine kinase
MKLISRFVLLIAALLLAVAASAGSGLQALSRLDTALAAVVHGDMERLLAITHCRRLFRSMVVLERDYLLATTAEERKALSKKLPTTASDLLVQIDKYTSLAPADDEQSVREIREVRTRWLELNAGVQSAVARGDQTEAVKLSGLHAKDPVSWEGVIGKLIKTNEKRLAGQVDATHTAYLRARGTLLAVSVLAALFAAGLGYVIFTGIRRNLREVVELNTNLEGIVKARTEALSARERSLRLVLDSTGDGLVGVTRDGKLAGGASAAAVRWFGEAKAGASSAAFFFPDDETRQMSFELALEQLLEDLLPWQVSIEMMPRKMQHQDATLELDYRRVNEPDSEVALLVLVRDVTARVQSEQAERAAREQQVLVGKLLSDKQGFVSFVQDSERLIQALGIEREPVVLRRDLHTLKGNVAIFGLGSLARLCHEIEDRLETEGADSAPTATELALLATSFQASLKGIEHFLTGLDRSVYEIDTDEHDAVVERLCQRKDCDEVLKLIETWSWSRTSEQLARMRAQAEYLGRRLEKPLRVTVEHNDLRLPPEYLERFWPTLVHVVRNAIDHGVEAPALRLERGKPAEGAVRLRTWQTDSSFCVEVADDGNGIDRQALLDAARAKGISVDPDATLSTLVFLDGLSTREEVSELSGRGVGLSATRQACEDEGGRIELETKPGEGTSLRFVFRKPVVKTGALAAKVQRRWSLHPPALSAEPSSGVLAVG